MTSAIEKHHLKLLKEFDAFCAERNIPYALAFHSAWDAEKFGGYHGGMYETSVHMTEEAFRRLQEAALPEGRGIVGFSKRGHAAKYADMNAIAINFVDEPVEKLPVPGIAIAILNRSSDGSWTGSKPRKRGGSFVLPGTIFDELRRVKLDDGEFWAFADADAYLTALAGESWRTAKWPYFTPKSDIYLTFDTDTDPHRFMASPVVRRMLRWPNRVFRAKYRDWVREKYNPFYKKTLRYPLYLTRTENRFDLWETYYPLEADLVAMSKDPARAEEFETVLEPLVERMVYWNTQKLGLSVDDDLLDLCMPLLERRLGKEGAEKLVSRIPEAYRTSRIEDVLRERGVGHPLLETV